MQAAIHSKKVEKCTRVMQLSEKNVTGPKNPRTALARCRKTFWWDGDGKHSNRDAMQHEKVVLQKIGRMLWTTKAN
jgi:hypothetical protein